MLFGPTDGSCRQQGPYFLAAPLPEPPPLHRTSGSSLIRTARDRSWSGATGKPAPPPRRWVPMSRTRPWRACAGTSKVCSRPSAPCAPASALRPRPPRRGPLAADRRCSGAAPAACAPLRRHQRAWPVPVPARLAWAVAACARPSLCRRPGPPLASLRPLWGRLGRRRHSVLPVALGLLWVVLRTALRATAGSLPALLRLRLGGSPQDGPARALPSLVPRSVGRLGGLTGSAPPARGLSRSPEGTAL